MGSLIAFCTYALTASVFVFLCDVSSANFWHVYDVARSGLGAATCEGKGYGTMCFTGVGCSDVCTEPDKGPSLIFAGLFGFTFSCFIFFSSPGEQRTRFRRTCILPFNQAIYIQKVSRCPSRCDMPLWSVKYRDKNSHSRRERHSTPCPPRTLARQGP